jgi:hypothetical protein
MAAPRAFFHGKMSIDMILIPSLQHTNLFCSWAKVHGLSMTETWVLFTWNIWAMAASMGNGRIYVLHQKHLLPEHGLLEAFYQCKEREAQHGLHT